MTVYKMLTFLFLLVNMFLRRSFAQVHSNGMLFDFTKDSGVDNWVESSDTVREVGMSKAALVLQKTQIFQRAILFTLLNPQPNGAGFAGVNYHSAWNLSDFNALELRVRGTGMNTGYKIVLRHKNQNKEPYPTYEQIFTVPINFFENVTLPFSKFKPYYRGRELPESEVGPLDISSVSSVGLQIYGGVYMDIKQSGVSSLEIDWIRAVK